MSDSVGQEGLVALFDAHRHTLPGASIPWLELRREQGMAAFAEGGIPVTRDEAWRYTDLKPLRALAFEAPDRESTGKRDREEIAAALASATSGAVGESHRLVFIDGVFSAAASSLGGLPGRVRVAPLAAELQRHPDRVRGMLGSVAEFDGRTFTGLNTAMFEDGVFLDIAPGQELSEPIHAVFVQTDDAVRAVHPRNLVLAGSASRATLIEHYVGGARAGGLVNPITEIVAEPEAHFDHVLLQEQPPDSFHIGEIAIRQEASSRVASYSLALGSAIGRVDIHTDLVGEGAHADLLGLYLGSGRQHLDHYTTIDHRSPHTTSRELYKGILGGRARGVFHGRIRVRPDAQKIDAVQINRNLLLSDGARIITKPQLEIRADDVRCSHGATIGRLEDDHVFYLRSRGIDADEARVILTMAFANEIAAELPIDGLHAYLTYCIRRWLPSAIDQDPRTPGKELK